MENFGGDLELKRLDLTWSGQVDLTAVTLRSRLLCVVCRHETVFVNLRNKPAWLFERNPLGLVPILEHRGNVVYESNVCNEFLEETFPGSSTGTRALLPSCPKRKAALRSLLQKFDTVSWLSFGHSSSYYYYHYYLFAIKHT